MPASRWVRFAEIACLTMYFVWLLWLPLPFGSVIESARLPLIAVPFGLCAIAGLIRLFATRDRTNLAQPTRAALIWLNGSLLFLATAALQLLPLAPSLLRVVSPQSFVIWRDASHVASLAGAAVRSSWPVTIDPRATRVEVLRLAAMMATFLTATLLIRNHARRRALATVLCGAALFEAFYGLREAALQRFEIWGWVNRLIFHRVTGTFVNPNHFAHYIVLILPMALFLGASLWRKAAPPDTALGRRFALLVERHALLGGFSVLTTLACLAAILLAQSRGALLALGIAIVGVAALLPGKRLARVALATTSGLLLVLSLALFLGVERTVARFDPGEVESNAVSRRLAMATAVDLWQRFPVSGSGLGTFERVVWMAQKGDDGHLYHHAHNDYLELAATGGTPGIVIGLLTLIGGFAALARMTFGPGSRELTWVRRAFQAAALVSVGAAMVHALFDFNFFIPANPATLAAIAGAAVASVDHDKRTRR
ncbi:MAG: O-antigen ligase family protein [Acidobacteriota bacterium]